MEQHQQSPKQRRYLSVVPFGDGDAIFPLYPPPVAMPWDVGRAQANMYQHKVGEAWLLDAEEGIPVALSAAGTPIRKNDRYMEYPFESNAFLSISLFYIYILSLSLFLFYIINAPVRSYFGFLIIIPIFFCFIIFLFVKLSQHHFR